ncbi:MAG: hypothetical protein HOB79_14035 [Rhodospirillaceae bacterium]|jgi:WD40 repeat protein|nr:hypothetical protein [Rhodospirillaceae bacterium]MBT4702186.1 hypothetical protein [Rhodospirillaceae bacterium]MBT5034119.1 hypothetical protein [Rhodospirillaceae bacterium]MBT6221011.1 hypothetical protein [Rhodospirillaceae bacterium]MBT6361283.1 hypothetical protein [Rhodospirillaceae bacterium]
MHENILKTLGTAIIAFGIGTAQALAANEPLALDPILRIEAGMHTAPILRVVVDKDERIMATVSLDKTVRIWSVNDGTLLRTIRVPVGGSYEGALYSLDISPDGTRIVTGGWTGNWNGGWSIYEFDVATGEMTRHVTKVPNRVNHMAYSPDGKYLAVSMKHPVGDTKDGEGLRIYNTHDFSVKMDDTDFDSDSVWAEFAPDGRLLVTGLDGYLRLYDKTFKNKIKKKAPGGEWIVAASFSPDGKYIAMGYGDSARVDIVSAKTLKYLKKANTRDIKEGHVSRVAWSPDGKYLYAGGRYDKGGWNPIRRWSTKSMRRYVEYSAVKNAVMQILPLKDGRVIFIGRDPVFGVINQANRKVYTKGAASADYRDNHEGFLISKDATTVEFAYDSFGNRPARFSLLQRKLTIDPPDEAKGLIPFVMEADGLDIADWLSTYKPLLNGTPLQMMEHDHSNAMAIAPDGQNFFLGTSWHLIQFDRAGKIIWRFRSKAEVWAINLTPDSKLVVTALGDGTIRWHRRSDGQELLAFFPHRDGKRWIAWTPSGYYMSSPGGDTLIGWHLNRGTKGAPDFFPAKRLRENFYRPDVVMKVLATLDEAEAIKKADVERGKNKSKARSVAQLLPPVINILSPRGGATFDEPEVKIDYLLRSPSGASVKSIKVLVDGRPARLFDKAEIKVGPEGYKGSFSLLAPRRNAKISLIAENAHAASLPSSIRLKWIGVKSDQLEHLPTLYVLAVGVSAYQDANLKLAFAAQDARDFTRTINAQKGLAYGKIIVKTLTDNEATLETVRQGLKWIQAKVGEDDVAMVFIAGHGIDDTSGAYHFLPHNAEISKLQATALPYTDIRRALASIKGLTYFFIDTCHSGDALGRPGRASTDTTRMINDLSSAENGVVIFASSTGEQVSYENPAWANGAFTEALVDGFRGEAALTNREYITVGMLNVFVSERVQDLTGGEQTPTSAIPNLIPDLHIALRR